MFKHRYALIHDTFTGTRNKNLRKTPCFRAFSGYFDKKALKKGLATGFRA